VADIKIWKIWNIYHNKSLQPLPAPPSVGSGKKGEAGADRPGTAEAEEEGESPGKMK